VSADVHDVIVVGGGPVGLLLGILLRQQGMDCVVLEKRDAATDLSQAIGIHPPGLQALAKAGVASELIHAGVRITVGSAYTGGHRLGTLFFGSLPLPYRFVLTVPQSSTEAVLEKRLAELAPDALVRGAEVTGWHEEPDRVVVTHSASSTPLQAKLLVGCDGKDSLVRRLAGIDFHGGNHRHAFVMGDFYDYTGWGEEARVFVDGEGFIESFPLPAGLRRWVRMTEWYVSEPVEDSFVDNIRRRTGESLAGVRVSALSSFRTQHLLATTFTKGRVALAGDAAHVMSPIGGQGMNVGWMDAVDLADAIVAIIRRRDTPDASFTAYNEGARERARRATERAYVNMLVGSTPLYGLRNVALFITLLRPFESLLARRLTMHGL